MWDQDNARQQEALGILGVNLIYSAFYHNGQPVDLIGSLMDGLTRDRVEVDMIKLSGPAFDGVDNRLMRLQLVEQRITNAVLFSPGGEVVEPAERRPALDRTGTGGAHGDDPRNLMATGERVEHADFLSRVDTLAALGRTVMISNYSRFHNVTTYLRRYTREPIGISLGVPTLAQIFDAKYYADLEGGILEALGRLLGGGPVRLYIYPARDSQTGTETTAESFHVAPELSHLYAHLLSNGFLRSLTAGAGLDLAITPHDVLAQMSAGDPSWEANVPPDVARVIKERRLFGLRGGAEAS
jgi:hypothetical protein